MHFQIDDDMEGDESKSPQKYPPDNNRDNSICVFEENINDSSFNQNRSDVAQDLLPGFQSVTSEYINDLQGLEQDQKRTETKLISAMTS